MTVERVHKAYALMAHAMLVRFVYVVTQPGSAAFSPSASAFSPSASTLTRTVHAPNNAPPRLPVPPHCSSVQICQHSARPRCRAPRHAPTRADQPEPTPLKGQRRSRRSSPRPHTLTTRHLGLMHTRAQTRRLPFEQPRPLNHGIAYYAKSIVVVAVPPSGVVAPPGRATGHLPLGATTPTGWIPKGWTAPPG